MQWFNSLTLPENWKLQAIVFLAIAVIAIIAVAIAYRALFAHRLRLPGGGRARQSRLGLVDAFSLDGQRQLVLVRRDNVEHLVMIGGPNDVVVESQIIRVHAQAPAPPLRDKENSPAQNAGPKIPTPNQPVAPAAAPLPQPQPQPPASPARPQPRPEPPNIAAQTRAAPKAPEVVARSTSSPLPPPRPVTTSPAPAGLTPAVSASASFPLAPTPAVVASAAPPPAAAPNPAPIVAPAPTPATPPVKNASLPPPIVVAAPPPAAPTPQPPKVVANANATPSQVASPAPPPQAKEPPAPKESPKPPAPNKAEPFSDLDSLEAEMAKLLGRTN